MTEIEINEPETCKNDSNLLIANIVGKNEDVETKINEILEILENYKYTNKTKSRSACIDELKGLLSLYYSINEFLIEKFVDLIPNNQILEFLDSCDNERPLTIRVNTLKTRRKELAQNLINRGVNLDPVGDWCKFGLVVYDSSVPIGATPEYLAGHYIIQGASSFLPVLSLNPLPDENILDMCAAPGGKTSHISSLMRNSGTIFANDSNEHRLKAVVANNYRLGVFNCVTTHYDAREYPKIARNFDRVLLDAPCTGTGVISKDPSAKTNKTENDVRVLTCAQKELILAAIDCVDCKSKNGGVVVYSTCSLLVEENEAVVEYALKNRDVRIVDAGIPVGCEGFTNFRNFHFNASMNLTRRIYPHIHNMDGFFIAKLKKISNEIKGKKENNTNKKINNENKNKDKENVNEKKIEKKIEDKVNKKNKTGKSKNKNIKNINKKLNKN